MHGLINRSIQCFLRDTYGQQVWDKVASRADLGPEGFEAMLSYEADLTEAVIDAATDELGKPRDALLEDLGTYLVSHPNVEALRRLLRFGGTTFEEFLHSLDELHDRARLAVPDLEMPQLELRDHGATAYTLLVHHSHPGFGHAMVGVLRAMADDYGALVLLEWQGRRNETESIAIQLLAAGFTEGRAFELGARAG